jgi:hypothetical protein
MYVNAIEKMSCNLGPMLSIFKKFSQTIVEPLAILTQIIAICVKKLYYFLIRKYVAQNRGKSPE